MKVKQALRLDTDEFDQELGDMIEEARAELQRLEIAAAALEKPLARRAIVTYCRAHFDAGSDESFRLLDSFRLMVDEMRTAAEYTADTPQDEGGDAP